MSAFQTLPTLSIQAWYMQVPTDSWASSRAQYVWSGESQVALKVTIKSKEAKRKVDVNEVISRNSDNSGERRRSMAI